MSAELEFLDNQNMILNMENRALKQHLDSVSREQHIKQCEYFRLFLKQTFHIAIRKPYDGNRKKEKEKKNMVVTCCLMSFLFVSNILYSGT